MADDRARCFAAGMDDFVVKPVRSEELQAVLSKWGTKLNKVDDHKLKSSEPKEKFSEEKPERTTAEDAIDLSGLRQLGKMQQEGHEDIVEEVITLFLRDTPIHFAALSYALERVDAESVRRVAHVLAGSSAVMGASHMATLSSELEQLGRAGDLRSAPPLVRKLQAEYERLQNILYEEVEHSRSLVS